MAGNSRHVWQAGRGEGRDTGLQAYLSGRHIFEGDMAIG